MTTTKATNGKAQTAQPYALALGDVVALSLRADTAPLRSYVGSVQYLGPDGVRITLMDWIVGYPASFDFYAPWRNVESALVATKNHDTTNFGDDAGKWQTQMNKLGHDAQTD